VASAFPFSIAASFLLVEGATIMKTITIVLLVVLILPNALFAAPSDEVQPSPSIESQQPPPLPKAGLDSDYSPRAQKVYLGTGIGTLAAGGSLLAIGIGISGDNGIGAQEVGTFFSVIGGTFLAASSDLWILYFREKAKEPPASLGLDLEKGKGVVLANFRF
jgi:hypothetical protein